MSIFLFFSQQILRNLSSTSLALKARGVRLQTHDRYMIDTWQTHRHIHKTHAMSHEQNRHITETSQRHHTSQTHHRHIDPSAKQTRDKISSKPNSLNRRHKRTSDEMGVAARTCSLSGWQLVPALSLPPHIRSPPTPHIQNQLSLSSWRGGTLNEFCYLTLNPKFCLTNFTTY